MNKVKSFLKTTMATNFIKFPFFEVRGYTPTREGPRKQSLERRAHTMNWVSVSCTRRPDFSPGAGAGDQRHHEWRRPATNYPRCCDRVYLLHHVRPSLDHRLVGHMTLSKHAIAQVLTKVPHDCQEGCVIPNCHITVFPIGE